MTRGTEDLEKRTYSTICAPESQIGKINDGSTINKIINVFLYMKLEIHYHSFIYVTCYDFVILN